MRALIMFLGSWMLLTSAIAQPAEEPGGDDPETASRVAFRIGVEDRLRIAVWGEPELNHTVVVRPDGKVSFPLIGEIEVEGSTPEEVGADVKRRLSRLIREPNVAVIVEAINSFRVYVLGEVARQGALNFSRPTRLLQALAAAGGLTQFSKKTIVLLREVNGVEQRIRVDYKRLLAGDPTANNLYLRPGDTILAE